MNDILRKSLNLLLKQQTNILSAAFIIMATVILSQLLGLVRQRILVGIFGPSDIAGVYIASSQIPDALFQFIIASVLSSAFIPIFSRYLVKKQEEEGYAFASTILVLGLGTFFVIAIFLVLFAEFFCHLVAPGYPPNEIALMANLMRIIIVGELFFIIASFFAAVLQSYNHFFIPGIAASLYNLGIIIGLVTLSHWIGIYAPAVGVVIGASLFALIQIPFIRKVHFAFHPKALKQVSALIEVLWLTLPRMLTLGIFQIWTFFVLRITSFLSDPGRTYLLYDYAAILAFAPVGLLGQSIAQAAFPVLSRQKEDLETFKATFMTSLYQMLYLVLPISVLFLVLRIPLVRLIYGAGRFDWPATVLTGRIMGFLVISMFTQALIYLVTRAFYALHDSFTPLISAAASTAVAIGFASAFVFWAHMGIASVAIAYTMGSILQFLVMFFALHIKTKGFHKMKLFITCSKLFVATFFTGFALYIPIKLLDEVIFNTTYTINLIILTGISSVIGLSLYVFLTWLFQIKEAKTYLEILKKLGNWRDILGHSDEVIEGQTHFKV